MVNPGYPSDHLQRFMAQNFPASGNPPRVLELGCGSGANLEWIARRYGNEHCGIEKNNELAIYAKWRLQDQAHIVFGDMADLPWRTEAFDLIIDIEAIYQNEPADIERIVLAIRGALKPGGWFFGQMMRDIWGEGRPGITLGHRFNFSELRKLFGFFDPVHIDLANRTWANATGGIDEWLVAARKPV